MLDQSYSKKSLRLYQRKIKMKGMTIRKRDELIDSLKDISKEIQTSSYNFNSICAFLSKNDTVWRTNEYDDSLVLRYTNHILKKVFKIKQSNRNTITNQVLQLLSSGQSFSIIRTDIKDFYESIPTEKLLNEIKSKSIFSKQVKYIISKVHQTVGSPQKGLPRGICYSPLLAELYMREFDQIVKSHESVFYYARYVDDIIIFVTDRRLFNKKTLKQLLPPELNLNHLKTQEEDVICRCKIQCSCTGTTGTCKCAKRCKCSIDSSKTKSIEYLGYKYSFSDIPVKDNKKKNKVKVGLAELKVKKIKTRIILSLLAFMKSSNYLLLKNRIKFLTSNYFVYENIPDSNLKAGIFFNYPELNVDTDLNDLDVFLRKAIFAKNKSFGVKVNSKLSIQQKVELTNFSFKKGYSNRLMVSFTGEEIGTIKNCWAHE